MTWRAISSRPNPAAPFVAADAPTAAAMNVASSGSGRVLSIQSHTVSGYVVGRCTLTPDSPQVHHGFTALGFSDGS